jgi:hypothetical protein
MVVLEGIEQLPLPMIPEFAEQCQAAIAAVEELALCRGGNR